MLTAVALALTFPGAAVAGPRFETTLQAHLDAVSARDLPKLERSLTAGPTLELYLPNGKRTATRREFVDFHRGWFREKGWTMRFERVSIRAGKDLASATVRTRYEDTVNGKLYWSENWLTLTFRLEGGAWRLVHDQNTRIRASTDAG